MNIYAKQGHKIKCISKECGFNDCAHDNPLVVGEIYTVNHTVVSGWHTDVYLEEFQDMCFNGVLFKDEK